MGKHLIISGKVQGVGYRMSFADMASGLGLKGWVRNRLDGTVEACIHGEAAAIEAAIEWTAIGPPSARVGNVAISESDEAVSLDAHFTIWPTTN